jgi:hypothetical protein
MTTNIQPIFQAKWPERLDPASKPILHKAFQVFQRVLYYLFFPITFTWSHVQNLVYRFPIMPGYADLPLEYYTGFSYFGLIKFIVRFLINPNAYKVDSPDFGKSLLNVYGGEKIQLKSPDGVKIEAAFFENKETDRVVFVSGGNGTQWETQQRWLDLLQPLGVSVLLFNPRGTGSSNAARSSEGWALDYYSACEYLYAKGYDPEKVLPLGFSMGGATSTRGVALVQAKYPNKKISALNMCSFSNLHKMGGTIERLGLRLLNIHMPVKSKWDTLKGEKVVMHRPQDMNIPYRASLAKSVKNCAATRIVALDPDLGHNDPFTIEETLKIQSEIRRLLDLPDAQ